MDGSPYLTFGTAGEEHTTLKRPGDAGHSRNLYDALQELGVAEVPQEDVGAKVFTETIKNPLFTQAPKYYRRTSLTSETDHGSTSQPVTNTDNAWSHLIGREKLSHLLEDPPCICGVSGDFVLKRQRRGTLTIVHDTHRQIDPERWRTIEHVKFELLSAEIEQKMRIKPASLELEEDAYSIRAADHPEHKNTLPNLHPASAHQMTALLQNSHQIIDDWSAKFKEQGDSLLTPDLVKEKVPLMQIMQLIHEEQLLHNAVFYEVIRQCTVHCVERGQLLADIRQAYSGLLNRIPACLIDLHNEMLLQRSVDRRLIESFLGYKMWWRTIRFLFDSLKESNNLHAFQNEGNLLLEEPGKRVHFLDGEDLPLKEHRQLYATQRALFCTDHQDLQLEKNVWRDLTQEFCRKLAHDHHSTNVGHLHTQWLRTATQAFQAILTKDRARIQKLRELLEEFVANFVYLEKRLVENEILVVRELNEIRRDLLETITRFMEREGPDDNVVALEIKQKLRLWISAINGLLSRFKAEDASINSSSLEKNREHFQFLIAEAAAALVDYRLREKSLCTCSDVDRSDVLNSGDVHTSGSDEFLEESVSGMGPEFRSPTTVISLTDEEFLESVTVISQLAGKQKAQITQLTLLRNSKAYCEMYRLWQRCLKLQPTFEKKIFGESGFTLEICSLEETLQSMLDLTLEPSFFTEPDPERFYNLGYALSHQIGQLVVKFGYVHGPKRVDSTSAPNDVKAFLNNVRSWFLCTEGSLEARTVNIQYRISRFAEQMLEMEAHLITTMLPDQVFQEQRYYDLYQEEVSFSKLDPLSVQLLVVGQELSSFSCVLDEHGSQNNPTLVPSAVEKVYPLSERWIGAVSSSLDRIRLMAEKSGESKEGRRCQIQQANISNFVEIRLHGAQLKTYVEPFDAVVEHNDQNKIDDFAAECLARMKTELNHKKKMNESILCRVRKLEERLASAKKSLQNNTDASYIRTRNERVFQSVLPKYADVPMDQIEVMLTENPPRSFGSETELSVRLQPAVTAWEYFVSPEAVDSPLGGAHLKSELDFDELMAGMRENLAAGEKVVTKLRHELNPLLQPNDSKMKAIAQKRRQREQNRLQRRTSILKQNH